MYSDCHFLGSWPWASACHTSGHYVYRLVNVDTLCGAVFTGVKSTSNSFRRNEAMLSKFKMQDLGDLICWTNNFSLLCFSKSRRAYTTPMFDATKNIQLQITQSDILQGLECVYQNDAVNLARLLIYKRWETLSFLKRLKMKCQFHLSCSERAAQTTPFYFLYERTWKFLLSSNIKRFVRFSSLFHCRDLKIWGPSSIKKCGWTSHRSVRFCLAEW